MRTTLQMFWSASRHPATRRLARRVYPCLAVVALLAAVPRAAAIVPEVAPADRAAAADGRASAIKDGRLQKLAQGRPAAEGCEPDAKKNDAISAALAKRAKGNQVGCVKSDRPVRFKIGNGEKDGAVLVRPLRGDVDAFLLQGGETIDTSLNAKGRPEVLLLQASMKNLEVAVAGNTPSASFEISIVKLAAAPADEEDASADPWAARTFEMLGFDLLAPSRSDQNAAGVHRRAILAFQAAEKFPLTGQLSPAQLDRLFQRAALQIDTDAVKASETARAVTAQTEPMAFEERDSAMLRSITAVLHDGRVLGVGEFRFGGVFEGEWRDRPEKGGVQRPSIGVLRFTKDCSLSLRTVGSDNAFSLLSLLEQSLGTRRQATRITFAGKLAGVAGPDASDPSAAAESICKTGR